MDEIHGSDTCVFVELIGIFKCVEAVQCAWNGAADWVAHVCVDIWDVFIRI
jgi:hypothetical protein